MKNVSRAGLWVSLLALLPGQLLAAGIPNGTWQLFKDSDGMTPNAGAVVELTLNAGQLTFKAAQPGETVTDTGTYSVSGNEVTFRFKELETGTRSGAYSVSPDTLVLPFRILSPGPGYSTWMTPTAIEAYRAKVPPRPSGAETMPQLLTRMVALAAAFGNTRERQYIDARAKANSGGYRGGLAEAYYVQGVIFFSQGYYREGWYGFAKAAQLKADNAVYLHNLANAVLEIGPTRDARTILTWVTSNYPNLDPPFAALGATCLQLKDYACARAAYDKARQLDPASGAYDYSLGVLLQEQGNGAQADALFRSAFNKGFGQGAR